MTEFRYRRAVLDELLGHGVEPRESTAPCLVRGHLNDLYTFELRKLRRELVAAEAREGRKLRRAYSERVSALRGRYQLLSRPTETWLES